jgi:hypothetical protein
MPLSTINSNSFSSTANTNIDNGTFNIDVTNNRVGINRSNPNVGFEVANSSWRLATYSGAGAFDGGLGGGFNPGNSIYSIYCRDRTDSYWNKLWIEANTIELKSGNGSFTAVSCDASGRVTMPYQPLLVVGKNNGDVNAQVSPIPYNDVIYNVGSHWNASTYRFTAPITGYYFCGIRALGTGTNIEVAIRRNGSTVVNTRSNGTSGTSTADSSIVYLTAGDYLDAKVEGSGGMNGGNSYAMSGMTVYLIG